MNCKSLVSLFLPLALSACGNTQTSETEATTSFATNSSESITETVNTPTPTPAPEPEPSKPAPFVRAYSPSDADCYFTMLAEEQVGMNPNLNYNDEQFAKEHFRQMIVNEFGEAAVGSVTQQAMDKFFAQYPATRHNFDLFKGATNGGAVACVEIAKIDYQNAHP